MKLIFLLSLGMLTVPPVLATVPLANALELGDDNRRSGWFDYFNDAHAPWYYHADHGWLFIQNGDDAGMWMWDARLGWIWTSPSAYPHVYEPSAGWLFYAKGTHEPRAFRHLSSTEWLNDRPTDNTKSYFPIPDKNQYFRWPYSVNHNEWIEGSFDGMSMKMKFSTYQVVLSGTDMMSVLQAVAAIEGNTTIEGELYDFEGNLQIRTEESLKRSPLGVFTKSAYLLATMNMTIAGQDFRFRTGAWAYGFDNLLLAFPWDTDLYEEPIGKTFRQTISGGEVSSWYTSEVIGYPDMKEAETFSYPFDPAPYIEMEIVAKHHRFTLGSYFPWHINYATYNRVVEVVVRQNIPDPGTDQFLETESQMWLAPGTGVIQVVEQDPVTDQAITLRLMNTDRATPRSEANSPKPKG